MGTYRFRVNKPYQDAVVHLSLIGSLIPSFTNQRLSHRKGQCPFQPMQPPNL